MIKDPSVKYKKALEIIVNKDVSISMLRLSFDVEIYNQSRAKPFRLTEEEFRLLKEVIR